LARFRVVSKHQVSGWKFLLNRIEHALVRRDASMLDDPGRGRNIALLIGVALACVCVAGAAVLAFFKPAKVVGDSKIVADQDSGALYVNLDGRLYPALNLTSARLIVGSPDDPVKVPPDELAKHPRGPWVGIPGAPGRMVGTTDRDSYWAHRVARPVDGTALHGGVTGAHHRDRRPAHHRRRVRA
jgi:type VII secretion protein EccB